MGSQSLQAFLFTYGINTTSNFDLKLISKRLNLKTKKPIVDAGVLSESELGIIGSALFFSYAIGKLSNGFLADHSNIKRFMAYSAITNSDLFYYIRAGIKRKLLSIL